MIKINVLVSNKNWEKYITNPKNHLTKKVKKLNKHNTFFKNKNIEFTLLLSGDKQIKSLNNKFRKKNKTTDVLSFPSHTKDIMLNLLKSKELVYLGDVIINLNKILDKKKLLTKITLDKIWLHGFAHLLGYRHKINRDYLKMKKVENKFFKSIN